LAISTRPSLPEAVDLAGQIWVPEDLLNAWGEARDAGEVAGVPGEALARAMEQGPSATEPPGLYSGQDRQVALNVIGPETKLSPAIWPAGVEHRGLAKEPPQLWKGHLLTAALVALLLDILASLWLAGR